jgi:hypothetical protein
MAETTADQLDDALWYAGLLPEYRQTAEQSVDLSEVSVSEAQATIQANNPQWFAHPRQTPSNAFAPTGVPLPYQLAHQNVGYFEASREANDRQAWALAGAQ